jgi:hypothetical protein
MYGALQFLGPFSRERNVSYTLGNTVIKLGT